MSTETSGKAANIEREFESLKEALGDASDSGMDTLIDYARGCLAEAWDLVSTLQAERLEYQSEFALRVEAVERELDCTKEQLRVATESWHRAAFAIEEMRLAFVQSTSWRLTQPLRALRRYLGRS
jgi:hypothetical protein